jgi:O-antigen/teichoic acid export membrane protein
VPSLALQNTVPECTAADSDAAERRMEGDLNIIDRDAERLLGGVADEFGTRGDAAILAKGASVTLTGVMAARALAMVTQILMARFLGAAGFGLYAIGWTLIRVLEAVNTLGLGTGVIYFGAEYQRNNPSRFKGVLRQSITFASLTGFSVGAGLYLLAPSLAEYVFRKPDAIPVIRAFAPAFPLYAIAFVGDGMTRLSQRMQYSAYSNIGSMASALMLFCVLFMLGWGVRGAVAATVGGIAVAALMSTYFARGLFPSLFAKEIRSEWIGRELFAFCIPVALAGLAASLLAFVDRLFVASFCSSAETGIYQAASQVSILFAIILGAFDSIFAPMVADLHARGENRRLAELYCLCVKWKLYACAPFFLIILFAPAELVGFLYGKAYAQGALPLVILSAGQIFTVIAGNSYTTLTLTGRQGTVVTITLVTLVFDLALNLLLVPRFGLVGAASSAAASALVLNLTTAKAVVRNARIPFFDVRYARSLGAVSFACLPLYTLRFLEITTPECKLFIVAAVSVAAFTGCLIALGLDAEDREVLDMIRARLRRLQPLGDR